MVPGGAPWFSVKPLPKVSLGSLSVLCVLKCVARSISRYQDVYLLKNLLATLLNLAPEVKDLHPYASQRIVKLLLLTSKRWAAGRPAQPGTTHDPAAAISGSPKIAA
ncbi:unnamed protein product, partial [Discosporangium mesarthrocarpum]